MERIQVSKEWMKKYEEIKNLLTSPVNYAQYFDMKEIQGKEIFVLDMGEVTFPSGKILVRDPLVWLNRNEKPYLQSVPIGKFKVNTLVVKIEEDHYRYVLSRVKFTEEIPVIYYEALKGDENLDSFEEDSIFGFPVDAGLATIVDVETKNAYCDFVDNWYKKNPDKNIYDDFFAAIFEKNAVENPLYQREGGDWINFRIPNTDLSIPMIQSGFGDGVYPVYFGYDKDNNLCDVVIEYIYLG
ncbi:PF14025 family protein [Peptoanaerobacter stomatis]|uniref:PF14025 family protein n=2 Tax=Peptoanaerobacter stomatis TaxID=796937 RepID=J6HGY4_9FIRM|nr:DUF4241 domain-containing protein [Peptoanaerobacter stomatis]EJU24225.1 PF14025 family protein [Peptoanaerobacter stomatis]NWO25202.1 DUF4241 domain-containing protein [Peptostreptococcaceae bacterium oral taxon 081]